jgi:nucleoside-diphosphate-sugar epimerase
VVSVFINKALHHEPVTIFGDGEVVRDYFYIDDLIQGLLAAKEFAFDVNNAIFNLGGMYPYTLNELVQKIEAVLGIELLVKHESARKFDVPKLLLDVNLARSYLNWAPTVALEDGIKRTVAWLNDWEEQNKVA